MKDQYFGDINDFRKYGLLLHLSGEGALRTGVCWMLTPPDGRTDGSALGYLNQPDSFRHLAPALFDLLYQAVVTDNDRRVARMEAAGMLPNAVYHSPLLPDDRDGRARYFREATARLNLADWVFFDPDNGIEVPSVALGRKGSSKFLYWPEIVAAYQAGQSVLIYQHFPRKGRMAYTEALARALRECIGAGAVFSFRTSHVVFFLLSQDYHVHHFRAGAATVAHEWDKQMVVAEHRDGVMSVAGC